MLNPIQFAGLIVITLLLLLQLQFAAKHDRPVLWLMALVCFVYFVYSGGIKLHWYIREWSHNFDVSEHYITVATWMAVLIIIAIMCGYSVPQTIKTTEARSARVAYNQILVLNVLGIGAIALTFYARGGIFSVWSRTASEPVSWAGVVVGLTELALIYPLFNYYYIEESTFGRLLISGVILTVYMASAVVSGQSNDHVIHLAPFLVVWLMRRKLTLRTALIVMAVGFALVSVTRFSRQLGATEYVGGDLEDAYAAYSDPDNPLNAANSFGEFVVFSQIVEVVDRHTGWQLGRTYLTTVVGLIPGVLLADKAQMLVKLRTDGFLPSYYGHSDVLWTSGFYGEAYVNFGLPGLIVVSWLVGMLIRRAEVLLRSEGSVSWLPHWCVGCLLAAAVLDSIRGEAGTGFMDFAEPVALAIIFRQVTSLLLPYGPVRVLGFARREQLTAVAEPASSR